MQGKISQHPDARAGTNRQHKQQPEWRTQTEHGIQQVCDDRSSACVPASETPVTYVDFEDAPLHLLFILQLLQCNI